MPQLYFVVEGETEQGFVDRVLTPRLSEFGIHVLGAMLCRARGYPAMKRFVLHRLAEHDRPDVHFTTMFDLYALQSNFRGFPGWDAAAKLASPRDRVFGLERDFAADIGDPRFLPHLQLYEYETLLLCGPELLQVDYGENRRGIEDLRAAVAAAGSVELVNDSYPTCPSNRIKAAFPKYAKSGQKRTVGVDVAEAIGLLEIRRQCPHFDAWVASLEALGRDAQPAA